MHVNIRPSVKTLTSHLLSFLFPYSTEFLEVRKVDFGDLFINDALFLYYTPGIHNRLAFPSWFYRMKRCVIRSLLLKGGK